MAGTSFAIRWSMIGCAQIAEVQFTGNTSHRDLLPVPGGFIAPSFACTLGSCTKNFCVISAPRLADAWSEVTASLFRAGLASVYCSTLVELQLSVYAVVYDAFWIAVVVGARAENGLESILSLSVPVDLRLRRAQTRWISTIDLIN